MRYEGGKWMDINEIDGDCVSMIDVRNDIKSLTCFDRDTNVSDHGCQIFFLLGGLSHKLFSDGDFHTWWDLAIPDQKGNVHLYVVIRS